MSIARFMAQSELVFWLTAPVMGSLAVPPLFLDEGVSVFQAVCFRAYRIDAFAARITFSSMVAISRI